MFNTYFLPTGLAGGLLLALAAGPARAQVPTLISLTPAANARSAPRNGAVVATFSQPLTAGSAAGLKVFSSQRGGLRSGGTATVAGSTLSFAPSAYDFRPGETVQVSLTRAVAGTGGALATPRVQQFTTAVGGTGRGTAFNYAGTTVGTASSRNAVLYDLDGDGYLDVVSAGESNTFVFVWPGLRSGGFVSSAAIVRMGPVATAVAVADLNGDGYGDLLSANASDGTLGVALNDGSFGFVPRPNVLAVAQASALALGDVDGDGDLDVLVGSTAGSAVSLLLNNGQGTFAAGLPLAVGSQPSAVALGDVDNDGDLDLVAANAADATVSVLLNTGSGAFGSAQLLPTAAGPSTLALGDVDRDGDLDLAVGSSLNGAVRLALNNGTGVFANGQTLATLRGFNSLTLADLDADGDLDLLGVSNYDANLYKTFNNGAGVFGAPVGQRLVGSAPSSIALGDIDKDGDLDVVSADPGADHIYLHTNDGTGPLATAPGAPATAATAALAAYPNPATGRTTLALPPTAFTAELLDALGRVLRTVPARAGAATLDVTGLAPGLYLVRAAGHTARLVVE